MRGFHHVNPGKRLASGAGLPGAIPVLLRREFPRICSCRINAASPDARSRADPPHRTPSLPSSYIRAKLLLCLLFIAATPAVASASDWRLDFTGLLARASLALTAGWAILNLVLVIVFARTRRYSSRSFALKHSCVASAGPMLGMLLALPESAANSPHYTLDSMYRILAIEAGLLVLAWLPLLVHRFQRAAASPASAT